MAETKIFDLAERQTDLRNMIKPSFAQYGLKPLLKVGTNKTHTCERLENTNKASVGWNAQVEIFLILYFSSYAASNSLVLPLSSITKES